MLIDNPQYELIIERGSEPIGQVSIKRLITIAESILKISEGAFLLRLRGVGSTKGRKTFSLEKSLQINIRGIHEKQTKLLCTALDFTCSPFSQTMNQYQLDLFGSEQMASLRNHTPISLFVEVFRGVLNNEASSNIDKPLLKSLKDFNRAFLSDKETFIFKNQSSIEPLQLDKKIVKRITVIEEDIPDPEAIIINGLVENLQYSKFKVGIISETGRIDGYLADTVDRDYMARFWGKGVTIFGKKHYRADKSFIVEIEKVFVPQAGDEYFSKKHISRTAEEQLTHQTQKKHQINPLQNSFNKWPGDEDFNELLEMLRK